MSLRTVPIIACAAALPLLAACSSSSSSTTPASSPTPSASAASPSISAGTGSPTPSASASASGKGLTVSVSIANGKITPPDQTYNVAVGAPISITVVSDTADELHSHCDGEEKPLPAGVPVTLTFTIKQTSPPVP